MSTTLTTNVLIGEFADAVLVEVETVAKPTIVNLINTGEVNAEAALVKFLTSLPKPGGMLGGIEGQIETSLENAAIAYAKTAVAKYGGDVVFALIDTQLHTWAKAIGG
jgi:hypothetical protein